YKFQPFNFIKDTKNNFSSAISNLLQRPTEIFEICNIEKTNKIYNKAHVFIGHAYGAPDNAKKTDFISPKIEKFIYEYSSKLDSIVFTGDVFFVPSKNKWAKLRKISGNNLEIIVAPGNHDVYRPDSRDVFNVSEFGKRSFPFLRTLDKASIIVEDSIQTHWRVSKKTIALSQSNESETIIIARHNSPIKELLPYLNGSLGMSKNLEHIKLLKRSFGINKNYYWIIGDSGSVKNLPRLLCYKFQNHTFILNGIGDVEGDSIIVYQDGRFFEYVL
ncbi:hypothetical protein N8011_02905, partial [Pseudomonadota bacterium]|nr:hypothetical protein [Pseudomonadota bacterium]